MAERKPVFELHIKPMFRLLDRQHMVRIKPEMDLWDYDAVKTFTPRILQKVGGANPTMPTADSGGAWPSEWVALLDRWAQGGFKRLTLGTAKNLKLADEGGGRYMLTCNVAVPATDDDDSYAWLESELAPGATTTSYRLYVLAGDDVSQPPGTVDIACRERVDGPLSPQGVVVVDAAGTHTVNPPAA
jgi:hypothetical protein